MKDDPDRVLDEYLVVLAQAGSPEALDRLTRRRNMATTEVAIIPANRPQPAFIPSCSSRSFGLRRRLRPCCEHAPGRGSGARHGPGLTAGTATHGASADRVSSRIAS